jgi:hypothetical protein
MFSNGFSTAGTVVLVYTALVFLMLGSLYPVLLSMIWLWFLIPFALGLIFWGVGFYQFVQAEKKKPNIWDSLK